MKGCRMVMPPATTVVTSTPAPGERRPELSHPASSPAASPTPLTGAALTKQCPKGQAGCVRVGEGHQGTEDVRCTIPKCQEGDAMWGACQGRPGSQLQPTQAFPGPRATTLSPSLPTTALPPGCTGQKDTATLWESLSVVEMADKLGQKLRRKSRQEIFP